MARARSGWEAARSGLATTKLLTSAASGWQLWQLHFYNEYSRLEAARSCQLATYPGSFSSFQKEKQISSLGKLPVTGAKPRAIRLLRAF